MDKILIAEDDGSTRFLVEELLKEAGYAVDTVTNGQEAIEHLRASAYDLLLTDIHMNPVNGLELLAHLKDQPSSPKVVVMTSDDTPETLLNAIKEQAYHYLHKPIHADDLLRLVDDALSATSHAPIEIISARPNWVELLVPCDRSAVERIRNFMLHLKADLNEELREDIGMAFHELLANAIEWGGQFDPNRKVNIAYLRFDRMLLYRIRDPGTGFSFENLDHAAVNNPDSPIAHLQVRDEKGLRPGGFGIKMVQSMVDELLYNETHNEVVFVKYLDNQD